MDESEVTISFLRLKFSNFGFWAKNVAACGFGFGFGSRHLPSTDAEVICLELKKLPRYQDIFFLVYPSTEIYVGTCFCSSHGIAVSQSISRLGHFVDDMYMHTYIYIYV